MGVDYEAPEIEELNYIMKYFPHLITSTPEETILDRAQSNSITKALLIVVLHKLCFKTYPTSPAQAPRSLNRCPCALHSAHLRCLVVKTSQYSGTYHTDRQGSQGSVCTSQGPG